MISPPYCGLDIVSLRIPRVLRVISAKPPQISTGLGTFGRWSMVQERPGAPRRLSSIENVRTPVVIAIAPLTGRMWAGRSTKTGFSSLTHLSRCRKRGRPPTDYRLACTSSSAQMAGRVPLVKWSRIRFPQSPASNKVTMTCPPCASTFVTLSRSHQLWSAASPFRSRTVTRESQRRCQYRDDQIKMRRRALLKSPQTLLGRISSHLTLWPPFRAYLHIEPELYYLLSSHFLRNLKPGPLKRHCRPAEK